MHTLTGVYETHCDTAARFNKVRPRVSRVRIQQNAGMFVCTLVMAGATVSTVHAESGFFVGANFGSAKYDLDTSRSYLPAGVPAVRAETDDSAGTLALAVGYRFGRYFGLEASYVDLGDAGGKETGRVTFPVVHESHAEYSRGVTGPAVAAFAVLPVAKLEFSIKAGVLFASSDYELVYSEFLTGYSLDESVSTEATSVGLGVAYLFTESFAAKVDWTRYLEVGDANAGEFDIDTLTAGFQFSF
jgi:Outer membrane protein beta-barrel domain